MTIPSPSTPVESVPQLPPPSPVEQLPQKQPASNTKVWLIVLIAVAVLALVIFAIIVLAQSGSATVAKVRDIFIIFMAVESVVLGFALVILIIQLATLINLIQNELKPMLKNTNDTVSTLRGTVTFLSNNLAEPVIKMNEYLAGLKKLLDLLKIGR
jgi:hypothetical protein